jgi:hypothetical protein
MAARAVGLLIAAAAVLAGCGLLPGSGVVTGFQGGGSCGQMNGGACREQMDLAGARHPDATTVDVTCTVPVCDRTGGAGTVVVTLANGAKDTEAFTYVGNAAPVPAPACSGAAMEVCRRLAISTVDGLPPAKVITAISVSCSASSCTRESGAADVRIRFADGSDFQTNSGWDGGLP